MLFILEFGEFFTPDLDENFLINNFNVETVIVNRKLTEVQQFKI